MAPTRGSSVIFRIMILPKFVLLINLLELMNASMIHQTNQPRASNSSAINSNVPQAQANNNGCQNGLLTFELATGFIYKPLSEETLAMMPSTLQLTDCLDYCLRNTSCLAINFEMGLCVLLSTSARQNPNNLYSSQFPVFTIYAEKKCLLAGDPQASRQRRKCQRAWTFERVAGYEMKTKPRRRLKLATKELCMEHCLLEREFECRSANWYRQTGECTLSDQDRHSVSQSEAGDQKIKTSALHNFYGPGNVTNMISSGGANNLNLNLGSDSNKAQNGGNNNNNNKVTPVSSSSLYENYYANLAALGERVTGASVAGPEQHQQRQQDDVTASLATNGASDGGIEDKNRRRILTRRSSQFITSKPSQDRRVNDVTTTNSKYRKVRQLYDELNHRHNYLLKRQQNLNSVENQQSGNSMLLSQDDSLAQSSSSSSMIRNNPDGNSWLQSNQVQPPNQYIDISGGGNQQYQPIISDSPVDYLENNCIFEPNKLCEFRKIQNRILKTVDSIYQDVNSVDECKQKCLNAPYRCYSFDYGDTSERVCRTSHLDQASLLAVKEPYLEVVGAITYELASCFNVTIQCKAKEMVATVSSSKMFKGKIYAKTRPSSCVNDVGESLKFELSMKYHDEACNVRASSNSQQGVFSNDIVIQHHDRIVTTQDVGLSVYCQYDLGNRSITNNVDLAIEKLDGPAEGKQQQMSSPNFTNSTSGRQPASGSQTSSASPLMITGLATTVVRSPNVTMRITNMNGQPVTSATVGDRLALLFEVKEKTSPFGIFVREIVAMDGRQVMQNLQAAVQAGGKQPAAYHYASATGLGNNGTVQPLQLNEQSIDYMIQTNSMANSVQFIDSDGCPTDANIMGPLIKMDPNGHRILAPFDAFKFPTSDMVFFRAIVTSCLAECAPVVCSPAMGGSNLPDLDVSIKHLLDTQSTVMPMTTAPPPPPTTVHPADSTPKSPTYLQHNLMDLASRTTAQNSQVTQAQRQPGNQQIMQIMATNPTSLPTSARYQPLMTTTTTMSSPMQNNNNNYEQFERMASTPSNTNQMSYSTSSSSSSSPTSTIGTSATVTTSAPMMTTQSMLQTGQDTNRLDLERRRTTLLPAQEDQTDALTTIPGFGDSSESSLLSASSSQWGNQNVTNNHNLGRAPAKLTSTTSSPQPVSQFASLNNLSEQQKLQIVQLFETRLKQQIPDSAATGNGNTQSNNISNISDLADLYNGFLATLMLKNSLAQSGDNRTSGNLMVSPDLDSMGNNYKRNSNENANYLLNEEQLQMANSNHLPDLATNSGSQLPASPSTGGSDFDRMLSQLTYEITNNESKEKIGSNNGSYINGLNNFINLLSLVSSTTTTSTTGQPPEAEDFSTEMNTNRLTSDEVTLASATSDGGQQVVGQQQPPPMDLMAANNNLDSSNSKFWSNGKQKSIGSEAGSSNSVSSAGMASHNNKATSGKLPESQEKSRRLQEQQMQLKKRISHQQAMANEYLGPYQSMGKRRRRREADRELANDLNGYVYMEQPLDDPSTINGSIRDGEHRRFTRAIVELYHTNLDLDLHGQRVKRSIASNPTYDVEELFVQSIKIVDRMHFEDEQQQHRRQDGKKTKLPQGKSTSQLKTIKNGEQNLPLTSGYRLANWSSAGLLSVLIMTMSFIFVQIFLVAIYLVNWSRRRRQGIGGTRKSLNSQQNNPLKINRSQPLPFSQDQLMLSSPSIVSTSHLNSWRQSTLASAQLSDNYHQSPGQGARLEDFQGINQHNNLAQHYKSAEEQQVANNLNLEYYYTLNSVLDQNYIRFAQDEHR